MSAQNPIHPSASEHGQPALSPPHEQLPPPDRDQRTAGSIRLRVRELLGALPRVPHTGTITHVEGKTIRAELPGVAIGSVVAIARAGSCTPAAPYGRLRSAARYEPLVHGEVVGLRGSSASIAILAGAPRSRNGALPAADTAGLRTGATVSVLRSAWEITAGPHLFGQVIDPFGSSLEGRRLTPATGSRRYPLHGAPPAPFDRAPVTRPLRTRIRAIDTFVPLGFGQRLAVLAEAGVGKSVLLTSIARHAECDVTVLALIGERGREVRELIEHHLPPAVRGRTITVVTTADEPAMNRIYGALAATRIAEHFRAQGRHVLLLLDSLTRLVRAYREVGLIAGEIPVRRGYPVSTYTRLPELLERAGATEDGSISALYTVLLTGELGEDPMVEEIKSLTDGHLVLRRELAHRGIYPAVDLLGSLSRLERVLHDGEICSMTAQLRAILSRYARDRELLALGAADPELHRAAQVEGAIANFITQCPDESEPWERALARLAECAATDAARDSPEPPRPPAALVEVAAGPIPGRTAAHVPARGDLARAGLGRPRFSRTR